MTNYPANFFFENTTIGKGQLTVNIVYNGVNIPAKIEQTELSKFHISYNPIGSGTYIIRVYYDGNEIQGSPFTMEVIDAKDVKTSGEGLNSGEVGERSSFFLNLGPNAFPSDVKVLITTPKGFPLQPKIIDRGGGNVVVEFSPIEAGEHLIDVRYFDKPISGSPFSCQVTDGNQIYINNIPPVGSINRPVEFEIDATSAGQGKLEISVNDGNVPCMVDSQGGYRFRASFVPTEAIPHVVRLRFNGKEVSGSPWMVQVQNPAANAMVSYNFSQNIVVNQVTELEVKLNSLDSEVTASVTGPNRRSTPASVVNMRNGVHRVEFAPREAGTHLVQISVDGVTVHGSPFVFKAYNPQAIVVTPPGVGTIGVPVEFTIDASKAGEGQLEIMVNKGSVPNVTRSISKSIFQVSFVPTDPRPHIVDLLFNKEPIPQSPLSVPIMDARGNMVTSQGASLHEVATNRHSIFRLHQNQQQQQQIHSNLSRSIAPNGEIVPAKMILQPDGDYKLDYMSKYTGRHRVEITSQGHPIMGSPFYVEIYDPNKIKVEGNKTGMVGERMELDIIRNQAGKADLKITVKGPRGNLIRYEMFNTPRGERVAYTPTEPGVHQIHVLFGNLNVPGCPVKQEIFDASIVIAEGEGLVKGLEDHVTSFYVDSRGQKGELKVQVDGPNSIAKCNITEEFDGRYLVSYIPVEPGFFNIIVKWNGREIEGSPFRPRINALQKVGVIGGWESLLDKNNHITLICNEKKVIEFDTRGCGQGQLTASLIGPSGSVPLDLRMREKDIYVLSFLPKDEGEYRLKVFWNGNQIDQSPLVGYIRREVTKTTTKTTTEPIENHYERQQRTTTTTSYQQQQQHQEVNSDKIILNGIGLQQAAVNQHSEFFIDGSSAGPGSPSITMDGPTGEIPVQCLLVTPCKYKCTYYPTIPGIYSLHIKWADRHVIGSPFMVKVQPASAYSNSHYQNTQTLNINPYLSPNGAATQFELTQTYQSANQLIPPSLVINPPPSIGAGSVVGGQMGGASGVRCSGEGLTRAKVGKEISTYIDTRRAGVGELTAQCNGPSKLALCRLVDPKETGVFTLFIKPVEGGTHTLYIKYNKENINGSPFTFKVSYPPDASKVQCFGAGINPGVVNKFDGVFYVDTYKAGSGELGVIVRGPKGGFKVELSRETHNDRRIVCSYHPSEPGDYVISVTWSGEHVPGSPFHIRLAETDMELKEYLQKNYQGVTHPNDRFDM
ncbi:hypothetical protein HELRODRAFT_173407 [Helobdella robusta]|uniref:Uncharacterized protein n=1 Tax=Helobdella robusta TaxID=6412 RepID=T1F6S3_HELRO|nr:hypothetical protein HELRODRAFT_173407 [Helobdella robusta]ESO03706.1 hypothetical protein HELRODRAFT_173407 [Helobdella robusta]